MVFKIDDIQRDYLHNKILEKNYLNIAPINTVLNYLVDNNSSCLAVCLRNDSCMVSIPI